jgi:CheY-like chemotaxis protein
METTAAVLVVDDNPQARAVTAEIFESLGFVAYSALHAEQALRVLVEHSEIGLLFTDIAMPGMNGIDLMTEARRIRPDLQVILTSGYVDRTSLPDVPFLHKPWRVSELAALVR